jgi:hypothetical protein
MTSAQLHPLVGQTDIVDRLHRLDADHCGVIDGLGEAAREITRLRCALRSVRASTDPRWQAQIISDALREEEGT